MPQVAIAQRPNAREQNFPTWEELQSVNSDSDESTESDEPTQPPPFPTMIANYFLNERLGSGYSGSIFKATNIMTRQVVAMKLQWIHHECRTNIYERHIYPPLQGGHGMPSKYADGIEGQWDYLAIELLGPSLDSLFRASGQTSWDLRSVCSIAIQLIERMRTMHNRGVLHRDIQLGNCVLGLPPHEKTIYMIDFGFSKIYIDKRTGRHIPDSRQPRDFIGNYWFSSVNVHCRGRVPSRRDDMEAVALMLIHLLTPNGLPWTRNGVPKTDYAHSRLKKAKLEAKPDMLCRDLPSEFEDFLLYTRGLAFKQCPDYERWVQIFVNLSGRSGFSNVNQFIWPPPPIPKTVVPTNLNTPHKKTAAHTEKDLTTILNDLAKIKLNPQPVLGDRTNIQPLVVAPPKLLQTQGGEANQPAQVAKTVSAASDDAGSSPVRYLQSKAILLAKLCREVSGAVDNPTLAALILEFMSVMQVNSSRTLTKDAIRFLEILTKKLGDPSVFIKPQREVQANKDPTKQPPHVKLGVAARLRREVAKAPNNGALAAMVEEFTKVTNRSTGRTITKDGFAFLEGVSERLKAIA